MADNDLNDVVEEEVSDAPVITVPIDDSLSVSGEAADAKAVGDALALKADKSELQATVNVNGQAADNQGTILLNSSHIPMSEASGAPSVKTAVEALQNMDAGDLPMDKTDVSSPKVSEAIGELQERSGEDIDLTSDPDDGSIAAAVQAVTGDFTEAEIRQMLAAAGYEGANNA